MKLAEARRLAEKVKRGEEQVDHAWNVRRKLALVASLLASVVFTGSAGNGGTPLQVLMVFLSLLLVTAGPACLLIESLRRRFKRQQGVGGLDERVLMKCGSLPELPDRIAQPLERAIDVYRGISRISEDPVWKHSGFPVERALSKAAEHAISLLDWGRRLGAVGWTVQGLKDRGEASAEQLRVQYESQLDRLEAAVETFHELEVTVSTAFAQLGAISAGSPTTQVVQELGAEFDALSEVFSAAELPAIPKPRPAEQAMLRSGR
jgi:hypothetical protein